MNGWTELDIDALDAPALQLHRANVSGAIRAHLFADMIMGQMVGASAATTRRRNAKSAANRTLLVDRLEQIDRRLFALEHDIEHWTETDETLFEIWRPR